MSKILQAVLLNDTRGDHHHGCDVVIQTIHELTSLNGIRIQATSPVHSDWRHNDSIVEIMHQSDLLLVNGEGTIHHDRPAGRWLLEAGTWAKERGIPSAMINMTWQHNSQEYVDLLRTFDLISVRESASATELRRCGVHSHVVPDLALFPQWSLSSVRGGIGFTDSVVPSIARRLELLRRQANGTALNILYDRRGINDLLRSVRRHFSGVTSSPSELIAAGQAVVSDYRSQTNDMHEFVRRVSGCRLLVTGRFHAVILALATRTPVLAVGSNTHKIEATLHDAGLGSFRIIQPDTPLTGELIQRASHWADEESSALDRYVSEGRNRIVNLFEHLRALVK